MRTLQQCNDDMHGQHPCPASVQLLHLEPPKTFSFTSMYTCFRQPYCVFRDTDFQLIEFRQRQFVMTLPSILEACTMQQTCQSACQCSVLPVGQGGLHCTILVWCKRRLGVQNVDLTHCAQANTLTNTKTSSVAMLGMHGEVAHLWPLLHTQIPC